MTWSLQKLGPKISQGEQLCAAIKTLLHKNGTAIPELGKIFVSAGPGSYTGIRIGMATALGLSLVHHIPVIPVQTLPCLALGAYKVIKNKSAIFLPLIKAQKGQVSGSLIHFKDELPHPLVGTSTCTPQEWVEKISDNTNQMVIIFGDGFLDFRSDFQNALRALEVPFKTFPDSWKYHMPQANCLADLDSGGEGQGVHALHYPRSDLLEFKTS